MKSYHFSVVKKGIVVAWPWLFRRFLLLELSSLVIYPFIFVPFNHKDVINKFNLKGMMNLIFLKQQEEALQVTIVIIIPFLFMIGWYALLLILIPLLYLLAISLFICDKHKKSYTYYSSAYIFISVLQEFPMFTEAYLNCNYPDYFKVRKIFQWRNHLYH